MNKISFSKILDLKSNLIRWTINMLYLPLMKIVRKDQMDFLILKHVV